MKRKETILALCSFMSFLSMTSCDSDTLNENPNEDQRKEQIENQIKEGETITVEIDHSKSLASKQGDFTYFSFLKKQLQLTDKDAESTVDWDIAFLTTEGRTNGGESGKGKAAVYLTETDDFDGIKSASEFVANADNWKVDKKHQGVKLFKMHSEEVEGSFNENLISWFKMDLMTMPPKVNIRKNVLIIRAADGDKYVKFQFLDAYGKDKIPGNVRFRYSFIPLKGEANTAKRIGEEIISGSKSLVEYLESMDKEKKDKIKYLKVKNGVSQEDLNSLKNESFELAELDLSEATLNVDYYDKFLKDNKNVKKVIMPVTCTQIGLGWMGYSKLEEVVFPKKSKCNKIGEGAFALSQYLKKITLPESLETIEKEAFKYCLKLESIEVPSNVIVLPESCFENCRELKHIFFKGNIRQLGDWLFYNCSALQEIKFQTATPPALLGEPFSGINQFYKILVPKSAVEAYKTAEGWSGLPVNGY